MNKEGESEPLSADDFTTIKDPWDEPGKPGRPHVTDYDADRISLSWDPPMKDGGAPIEEYIIEVRDPNTKEWKEIKRSPGELLTVQRTPSHTEWLTPLRITQKSKHRETAPIFKHQKSYMPFDSQLRPVGNRVFFTCIDNNH